MRFDLSSQNTRILQEQKRHRQWMVAFLVLSVTVVLGTAAALKLYGQALTHKVKVLDCRAGVHEHTEECYVYDEETGEDVPVCGYADYLVHIHNDDCRDKNGRLVCPLEEIEPHKHTDECYEERRVLVCGLEGIEPAQGADTDAAGTAGNQPGQTPGGGAESQPVKTTEAENQPEQTSGAQSQPAQEAATEAPSTEAPTTAASAEAPVETESKLACAEEEHTHTNDCYGEAALSCGLEEHKHGDACYEMTLTCETPEHAHESSCYDENGELICGFEEHEHGDDCYKKTLTCETPEHEHGDACYGERELTCKKKEHAHTDACYAQVAVATMPPAETKAPETKAPAETKAAEAKASVETKADETTTPPATTASETTAAAGAGTHVHTDACYETRLVPVCGKLELHTHDEDCYDEDGRLICELPQLEQHTHNKDCFKTIELTDEEIAALNAGVKLHIHHEDCYDENGELICGHEETHIHGEKCYDKDGKLICGHDEAHVHSDDCYDENGDIICGLEVVAHEHTDDCYDENGKLVCDHAHIHEESCFDEDGNMTCDFEDVGDYLWTCEREDYTVTARFTEEAGIPGNAKLEVEQVTAGDTEAEQKDFARLEKEYKRVIENEGAAIKALFNIGFRVEDKETGVKTEITPKTPVELTIRFTEPEDVPEDSEAAAVFYQDGIAERIDAGDMEDYALSFRAEVMGTFGVGFLSGDGQRGLSKGSEGRSILVEDTFDYEGEAFKFTIHIEGEATVTEESTEQDEEESREEEPTGESQKVGKLDGKDEKETAGESRKADESDGKDKEETTADSGRKAGASDGNGTGTDSERKPVENEGND